MTSSSEKTRNDDTIRDILNSLETTAQVRPEINQYIEILTQRLLNLTRDYYASIVYLFTTPLSFHKRLILMQLIAIFPQGLSGIDIARTLGISVKSKSIYNDLKALEKDNLVKLDEIHSRMKLAYANADNKLVLRMVELVQLHGDKLQELLTRNTGD